MPLGVEGFENTQNFFARPGIQIAGGLVGQDQRGMGGDGPGDGRALLLPAGHLGGPVIHPFLQPHLPQAFHGHMPPFLAADAPVDQRQLHIFQRRQPGHQIEALKHEADVPVADEGQLPVG